MTKEIHIKYKDQMFIALVDDEDYPLVNRYRWRIMFSGHIPYAITTIGRAENLMTLTMHNFILGSSDQIDHEDRNSLNNQKHNFRPANHQQNGWNKGKQRRHRYIGMTSQYKGVRREKYKGKDRFLVTIGMGKGNKTFRVGYFDSEIEAAKAYNEKVVELRGEFAWVNPIPEAL